MVRNVTIVHVEDEFADLVNTWPRRVSNLLNAYLRETVNCSEITRPNRRTLENAGTDNIDVREFVAPNNNGHLFRYIFIGDIEIPDGIKTYLGEVNLFVVDVLRDSRDGNGQKITALQSIASAKRFGAHDKYIVVFTALQGLHLKDIEEKYPDVRIISKLRSEDLEGIFLDIIKESTKDA